MKIIDVKFDASKFIKELDSKPSKVKKAVADDSYRRLEIIDEHTRTKVPLETGKLRQSVMRPNTVVGTNFVEQEIQYSALNERTLYDYAYIQETNVRYTHRVGGRLYFQKGMMESLPYIMRSLGESVSRGLKE